MKVTEEKDNFFRLDGVCVSEYVRAIYATSNTWYFVLYSIRTYDPQEVKNTLIP